MNSFWVTRRLSTLPLFSKTLANDNSACRPADRREQIGSQLFETDRNTTGCSVMNVRKSSGRGRHTVPEIGRLRGSGACWEKKNHESHDSVCSHRVSADFRSFSAQMGGGRSNGQAACGNVDA